MKKNILIIVTSIIILLLGIAFYMYTLSLEKPTVTEEDLLADVEVIEEVSKTQDIENVSYTDITIFRGDKTEAKLSEYKDKAVMLLFFNKENKESIEVLNKVEEMYKNYEDKIQFFMINTAKETDEELENNYEIEIYYDFYEEAAIKYGIEKIPSMIYINELNEVFNAKAGFTTTDALEANLDILSNNI